jgi:hypothetical protein
MISTHDATRPHLDLLVQRSIHPRAGSELFDTTSEKGESPTPVP